MNNQPLVLLRNPDGSPMLDEKGKKIYNQSFTNNFVSEYPNRSKRRQYLQKIFRNPFYGINVSSKYIQVVPETVKNEEGIITKLGRMINKTKRGVSYTGKVKVIDHYPYNKNKV